MSKKQEASSSRQGQEALLEVAQRLFTEHGYANVSMQQIAEEAGMTKGAPYYYFQNKEALFARVSVRILSEIRESVMEASAIGGTFQERLIRCILTITRSTTGNLEQWFADFPRVLSHEDLREIVAEAICAGDLAELLLPRFEEAAEKGEFTRVSPRTAASVFQQLLMMKMKDQANANRTADTPANYLETSTEELVDIFMHGIR
ncbi:MAG TPA: TetR/AcrR family transcriptional regulator [Thermomicrobiales bacterium]|nr:TetR/AcrR family transcriptional regulator [Thermomicrobiales bacterium]